MASGQATGQATAQLPLQKATLLAQAGQLDAARRILQDILTHDPRSIDALALLSRIAAVQNDVPTSRDAFTRALELAPHRADLNFDYGNFLAMQDDLVPAVAALAKASSLTPGNASYHYSLGCAQVGLGNHAAAAQSFRKTVILRPNMIAAWESLGASALASADWATAIEAYRCVLDGGAATDEAIIRLSLALRANGDNEGADTLKAEAISRDPGSVLARTLVDMALGRWGGGDTEQDLIDAHLADPLAPDPLCDLAEYLESHGRLPDVLPQLIAAAVENGDHARIMALTGQALIDLKDVSEQTESILLHADALARQGRTCYSLGALYERRGNVPNAEKWFRKAHELEPTNQYYHSTLLFTLRHSSTLTPAEMFAEHRRFGEIQEARIEPLPLPPLTPADAGRPLRIGFVSPDFREHAVTMFFEPYLDHLDRSQFHVTLYYTHRTGDAVTQRLQGKADRWRPIANLAADDAARLVQSDGIDILIDLAGHTATNGLAVFLHKPAHVQMTWLGYPATTGLTRMDYRITELGGPSEARSEVDTETLLSLGGGGMFRPPARCPDVVPPPILRNGFFTFGSLNRPTKITDQTVDAWARILTAVPASRLVMVLSADEMTTTRDLHQRFAAAGIASERLEFRQRVPLDAFMSLISEIDIALDPFPYAGGTTSWLTLWMGVPFISMTGTDDISGAGLGALTMAGVPELAATTPEGYVRSATDLAGDLDRLTKLRTELRARLMLSPILEESRGGVRLGELLRKTWRKHVLALQPVG